MEYQLKSLGCKQNKTKREVNDDEYVVIRINERNVIVCCTIDYLMLSITNGCDNLTKKYSKQLYKREEEKRNRMAEKKENVDMQV